MFICCAFGLNPRFPGDKAGWACRCYILLLRGFRFTYQDKETYRFHPSFSLGTVREGDPGNCRTTVEQNYYGRVVPMKKCLAATRKPNKLWLKAEEHLNSTLHEVWRQVAQGFGGVSGDPGSFHPPAPPCLVMFSGLRLPLHRVADTGSGFHVLSCPQPKRAVEDGGRATRRSPCLPLSYPGAELFGSLLQRKCSCSVKTDTWTRVIRGYVWQSEIRSIFLPTVPHSILHCSFSKLQNVKNSTSA